MAVTITRTAWTDDDGSGTTGTVINNAVKTELYNQIDAALAALLPLAGGTLTGDLLFTSDGSYDIGKSGATRPRDGFFSRTLSAGAFIPIGSSVPANGIYLPSANAMWVATNSVARGGWTSAGRFLVGATDVTGTGKTMIDAAMNAIEALVLNDNSSTGTGTYINFTKAAGTAIGSITSTAPDTGVAYNTSSDKRLKDDLGLAVDLSALRAVEIHDFTWKANGLHDRGVFAQDAVLVFPRAITHKDDAWGADYSKFVPDLIVGWQDHEARLAKLERAA